MLVACLFCNYDLLCVILDLSFDTWLAYHSQKCITMATSSSCCITMASYVLVVLHSISGMEMYNFDLLSISSSLEFIW